MGKAWSSVLIAIILAFAKPCSAQIVDTICTGSQGKEYYVTPTPGSLYFWQVENGGTIVKNENHKIKVNWKDTTGTFNVQVVEQNRSGCFGDTIYATIVILPLANLNITGPDEICEGEMISLNASGAPNLVWNSGSTGNDFNHLPQRTTTYYVTSQNYLCGEDSASHTVRVHPRPIAMIKHYPPQPRLGEKVFFENSGSGADNAQWLIDPKGDQTTEKSFFYTMSDTGYYHIQLIAFNDFGCTDTADSWIRIKDSMMVYVPNAFSPNGDLVNDVFEVKGVNIQQLTVQIYSRHGGLIHEFNGIEESWDGTKNGYPLPVGVYGVIVEAIGESGEVFKYKGNVTLLQ